MAVVKNVGNSSELSCKCGSWLQHWEKGTGNKANSCAVADCKETIDLEGGHVQKIDITDNTIYITPLCNAHISMKNTVPMYVPGRFLIPAYKNQKCLLA